MNDLRSKLEAVQVGGCVTTAQLAHALDKRSKNLARSGRDWCQARGIKYKPDGKTNWVRVKDVLDHIEKLFHDKQPSNDRTPAVVSAIRKLTG